MIMSGPSCSAEGRGGFINEEVNEDEMKVFPFELAGKISDNTQHTREKIKGDVPKITVFRFYIITEALSVISLSAANDKQFFAQILQPFLLTQQQQQQQTKNKKQKTKRKRRAPYHQCTPPTSAWRSLQGADRP